MKSFQGIDAIDRAAEGIEDLSTGDSSSEVCDVNLFVI